MATTRRPKITGDDRLIKEEKEKNAKFDIQLNEEQRRAKEQILTHPFSFILGKAGSGKTLLATATATDQLFKKNISKIVITRPTVATEDNGFLPGNIEDKLDPWLVPIKHNLRKFYNKKEKWEQLEKDGAVEIVALSHFRGRTFENAFCIVDECFPYTTKVKTDKGMCSIRKIYKDFQKGKILKVMSYNADLKDFEYKNVIGARETLDRCLVRVSMKDFTIQCTANHKVLTTEGYKEVINLKAGDICIFYGDSNKSSKLVSSQDVKDLIVGTLMGDGYAQDLKHNVFRICFTHGIEQEDYCVWKAEMLLGSATFVEKNGFLKTPAIRASGTSMMICDLDVFDKVNLIENITWKSLAISWMDGGHLYKAENGGSLWSFATNEYLSKLLSEKLNSMGLATKVQKVRTYYKIILNKYSIIKLSEYIAPFVHPSMQYKICSVHRQLAGTYLWNNEYPKYTVKPFTKVEEIPNSEQKVYDIEVEDNHNFLVTNSVNNKSHLVVHNCQNLTKSQLQMCIGRLGQNSRMVFCGDLNQIDLKSNTSAIKEVEKLKGCSSVFITELLENHRHPAVTELLTILNA